MAVWFLSRDAMLALYMMSSCVCLSACAFDTFRYCIKTAKRRIAQIMLHNSPGTLHCSFFDAKDHGEISTALLPTGATNAGGVV